MDQDWLASLPDELGKQRRILRSLVEFCEADADARWFAVSCSLARGAADALSDVDAGIGVEDTSVAASVERLQRYLTGGVDGPETVDVLLHQHGAPGKTMTRLFVQYANGGQLDLVVMPASQRPGRAPDEVVLYDVEGRLGTDFTPSVDTVTAEQIREWTFLGWIALADATKYLTRGSLWEAHNRLHEARDRIWALWAAAKSARYPTFGLSQVLDRDPGDLPPGIEGTVADLDAGRLRLAVIAAGGVLEETSRLAGGVFGADLPSGMAAYCSRMWSTTFARSSS